MPVYTIKTPRGDEVDIDAPDEATAIHGVQQWDHQDWAMSEAARLGVKPDLALRVMKQESGGRADAVSPKGARGPMQLMPGTAKEIGVNADDPYSNISGGLTYLKRQLDAFGGDEARALAAYNAGPGAVRKYGGVPPFAETQKYVQNITGDGSIRRGADGTIEVDINKGNGGSYKPPPAPALAPDPVFDSYNKGLLGEVQDAFDKSKGKLDADVAADRKLNAERDAKSLGQRLRDFPKDELRSRLRQLGVAADTIGVPMSLLDAPFQALVVKPAAEAISAVTPTAYKPTTLKDVIRSFQGQDVHPQAMTPLEKRQTIADAVATALSTVMPSDKLPVSLPAKPPKMARRVADALERAAVRDETTLADVAAKARAGGDIPAFQAGGENMASLAEVAAQVPGKAATKVTTAVRNDRAAASRRIKEQIGEGLGGEGNFLETLDAKVAERRANANSGIKGIENAEVKLQPGAVQALRSDLAKGAVRDAAQNMLASPDDATRAAGAELNRLADTLLDNPGEAKVTVRGAQDISKSLLDAADAAYKSGNGARGKALKDLGKAVRENAANPNTGGVKEYGDWLKQYGTDSDHIDALELGRNVLSAKRDMSAEGLRKAVADMDETSRAYFRKGVGEAVLNEARTKGSVNAMRRTLKEEIGDRVRVAFPDDASYAKFMDAAEAEVLREAKNNRILGNSRTFGRQAAMDDLREQAGIDPAEAAGAAVETVTDLKGAAGKALKALLDKLPKKDRSILGDPAMNELLGNALTDPDEMTKLLNTLEVMKARRAAPMAARLAPLLKPALATDAAINEASVYRGGRPRVGYR